MSGTLALKEYFRSSALGEGSFGSVVTVYDDEGTELALKMFENDEDNDTLDSGTLRELSILRLLREGNGHPGLIPMIDIQERNVGSAGDCLSMAMPRYKVGDLQHLLDGGAFPKGKKGRKARIKIAYELLSAVAYLNDNNIMHRDIKADNVMLTDDYRAVLIDFSLAKIIDGPMALLPPALTYTGGDGSLIHTGEVGTPTYCAPEVVALQPYGTKVDAWSAGVVLLEMLHGHTLQAEKDKEAFRVIEEVKQTLPDKPFANLIRSLLEVDVEKRMSCRDALSSMVFSSSDDYPVPPVRLINFADCLLKSKENAENHQDSTSSSSSSSSSSSNNNNNNNGGEKKRDRKGNGKNGKNDELTRQKRMIKAIRTYTNELGCKNPNIERAALLYANELRQAGYDAVDVGSAVLLDCVILAEKFFDGELRDFDELEEDDGEDFPSFKAWDLEAYKENESAVFQTMDYCLYLRSECVAESGAMGGKKKKVKR